MMDRATIEELREIQNKREREGICHCFDCVLEEAEQNIKEVENEKGSAVGS